MILLIGLQNTTALSYTSTTNFGLLARVGDNITSTGTCPQISVLVDDSNFLRVRNVFIGEIVYSNQRNNNIILLTQAITYLA